MLSVRQIILASGSPRRKNLLQQINLPFEVKVSSVDESFDADLPAAKIAQELALRKARDIAQQCNKALVIGADTIVVFEDEILGKPADHDEARQMLDRLSGKIHHVLTGVALCKVDASQNITDTTTFAERTKVVFGDLSRDDIETYVADNSPLDKAGAYGIQDDFGAIFVKRIEGDYYNVVGFPLHSFYNTMKSFAPEYFPQVKLNTGSNE